MKGKRGIGQQGEEEAARYLGSLGYILLERNYHTRSGEIDLIALDGDALCFIEVKARSSNAYGTPAESVHPAKQQKLTAAAEQYLCDHPQDRPCRFDVVEVRLGGSRPACRVIRDAFMAGG